MGIPYRRRARPDTWLARKRGQTAEARGAVQAARDRGDVAGFG